ncbi:hypothetical protein IDH44_25970 [Paenibacillus sp. IB182496]|uniref:Uncharacterized protein n=1 Tax=Paenibacillus sabuli TaxID=2772509 RepID=A0A927BYD1_9BACL|nr:hypothetical protein [Paenibacillus sabuli]MBD2848632.1 hypothetical protein [Paenibacillus sabuli]
MERSEQNVTSDDQRDERQRGRRVKGLGQIHLFNHDDRIEVVEVHPVNMDEQKNGLKNRIKDDEKFYEKPYENLLKRLEKDLKKTWGGEPSKQFCLGLVSGATDNNGCMLRGIRRLVRTGGMKPGSRISRTHPTSSDVMNPKR